MTDLDRRQEVATRVARAAGNARGGAGGEAGLRLRAAGTGVDDEKYHAGQNDDAGHSDRDQSLTMPVQNGERALRHCV